MRHLEGQTQTSDGLTLYTQTWLPDRSPKAMVAFIHGLSEHSGRYGNVANALIPAGYGLHMVDLRGHGKSPGVRGHIMAWADYHKDVAALMESAQKAAPEVKKHFFGGHSLGGLIGLSVALSNPPGQIGCAVSAPLLRLAFEPPGWLLTMAKLLSGLLPSLTLSNQLERNALSRDPAVVEAYNADPMVPGLISVRTTTEMTAAAADTLARAGEVRLPLLIMQGAADRIVAPSGSQEFYEHAGSSDKTLRLYEGYYHEIFNDIGKEQPLSDLVGWLDAHL